MKQEPNLTKAERTRQFIIEKTAPIFNTKGYAGTSLNDMTDATGLTKGSIYGNFENKDEVALAVFEHNVALINAVLKTEITQATTNREKLLAYITAYKNILGKKHTTGGCPILNTAVEADDTHPQLRKRAAEALLLWRSRISGIIEKGIAAGEFRNEVKPQKTALTMIAMIEGAVMISKLLGSTKYLDEVLDNTEKLIEDLA